MNTRENGKRKTSMATTMLTVGSIVALGLTFSTVTTSITGLVTATGASGTTSAGATTGTTSSSTKSTGSVQQSTAPVHAKTSGS
jgi:hypothetical protein